MTETAMAAALQKARYETKHGQLYLLACEMLTKSNNDIALCHSMLETALSDKRGINLPGEGHIRREDQKAIAQSRQPQDGGGGQVECETQPASASFAEQDRTGHSRRENHISCARPVLPIPAAKSNLVPVMSHIRNKPGRARGADAIATVQGIMAKAIVFRLTDGRDIMEAQFHELAKIERGGIRNARKYTREAFVARFLLANMTYANPDPFAKVGDLFPPKTIELAVAEAEKEASHAA